MMKKVRLRKIYIKLSLMGLSLTVTKHKPNNVEFFHKKLKLLFNFVMIIFGSL